MKVSAGSRRRVLVLGTVAAMFAVLLPVGAQAQTLCSVDTLVPVLRDVTINQGLHNYPALVNGKQTLTKFYLSRPLCAGTEQTIRLTSAVLKVNGGAVATITQPQNNLSTPPELVPYSQAPAKSSSGDPLWVVSGDALASLPQGGPLSFEAILTYTSTLSTAERSITLGSFNGAAITKALLAQTESLRLLAVRMGDPNATTTQFTTGTGATAEDAYLKGLATLSRMFPVAGGIADLNDSLLLGKGIRHNLKTGIFDVSRFMSSGKFCDDGGAFGASGNGIKLQLADHLQQYNTANTPDKSADRIMGVVDEAISAGCAEGIASFGGKESWVTARYNKTSTKRTGATMGMELGHNAGGVPCGGSSSDLLQPVECAEDRDHDRDAYHSRNVYADVAPGDVDRSFNIYGPDYFLDDARSVMQFQFQPDSNWTNASTLLEPADWSLLLCRLGGPLVEDCTVPVEQTAVNAAATNVSVLVGTTDGTKENTHVFDSFAKEEGVDTFHAPSGAIHLLQKDAAGVVLSDIPVWVIGGHSDHTPDQTAGHHDHEGLFSVSYATPPGTERLELRNMETGELLYSVDENASGVRNVQVSLSAEGTGGCGSDCGEAAELKEPFSTERTQTISFDDLPAGTKIKDQYFGVTFTGDMSEPTLVGDCLKGHTPCRVPQASTASGDIALWNKPLEVPIDPAPTSENKDLQIAFDFPQRRVGMYIGNDDSGSTRAELKAFDEAGNEIVVPGGVTRTSFGSPVQTFLGLDAGSDRIKSVTLSYGESPFGEEIDSLMYEATTTRFIARTTAEHDDAKRLRAHYFAKCDDANEPLETSVAPTSVSDDNKVATWEYAFEAKDLCTYKGSTVFLVRINDGFTQTEFVEKIVRADQDDPPSAFITTPDAVGQAPDIFQYEEMSLRGLGHDEEDGVLLGEQVRWYLTGPDFAEREEGTGDTKFVPAPAGGWTPGQYTARLVVTDSSGNSDEDTLSITVKKDADNDYIVDGACGTEDDANSSDAFADWDNDGMPNHSDDDPCKAFVTATADFDPDELNVPSTGGADKSVTMKISTASWNLNEIEPTSVHIAEIAGIPVQLGSTAWQVAGDGLTATAKFNRDHLIHLIYEVHGIKNRRISISLDAVSNTAPQWRLRATDSVFIKYSG